MRKFAKFLISGLIACTVAFSAIACDDGNSPTPPSPPPIDEGGKVTINDAYDWNGDKTGSTRPDLGGDYNPTLPPTEAVVTIADGSSVRFKGGKTEMTLPVGTVIKQSDFDEGTLGGRTVAGMAVLNEENKISSYLKLSEFVPLAATSVLPYFAPEKGDAALFGSNKVGDYFYDATGADLANNPEYKLTTEYRLVDSYMGINISLDRALEKDTYFRSVTRYARESGQTYTYRYTFVNTGENTLSFTVYQMHTGHAWADSAAAVAGDAVVLEAGAKKAVAIEVANDRNDSNSLTLIRFDEAVEKFSVAVSMAIENSTPTEPATITLDLPNGFKVNGYETNVRTNDKLRLPTAAQIENNTGHKLLYWAYADGSKVVEDVRLTGDITIKPILTEDVTVTLDLPNGFTVTSDYVTKYQTGDKLTLPTEEQITNNTGRRFIRWVDGNGNPLSNGKVLDGNITLKAELSETATITVKLPAGLTVADSYVKTAQTGDILVTPTDEQILGTIPDGRRILGWYIVGNGNKVVTETTEIQDRNITIAPYFSRIEGTATMMNWTGDDAHRNGKELVFASIQGDGKPHNVYDATGAEIKNGQANFTAVNINSNTTPINGGENGFAEYGNVLQYNGTLGKDYRFRGGALISGGAGVLEKGLPHTFYYNFQNFGDTELDFTVYGLNSGVLFEGDGVKVVLQPGESTRISFTVTYKNAYLDQPNKNAMAYFWMNKEVTNMKLGLSFNVILGRKPATISLKSGIDGFTLNQSYLDKEVKIGDKLVLPKSDDYTDTLSAKRSVVGWTDASGNELHDGDTVNGNITLVPVFEEYATVTVSLPEGVTLNGYEATKKCVVGDKLTLPTDAQINNTTGKAILYWIIKDTSTVVTNDTVIEGDMEITPVLETDQKEPVTITATTENGFSVSESYLTKTRYKGELLQLPKEGEYTNTTGKRLTGWRNHETQEILSDGMLMSFDSLVLEPILVNVIRMTYRLPNGVTLADTAVTDYVNGETLVLPTAEQLVGNAAGAPIGWYNAESGEVVENGATVEEEMILVPYWEHVPGYNYVVVGSGAASGYNGDQVPGELIGHFGISATYYGKWSSASSRARIISGGEGGYSVLGSIITDTAPIKAGSAIRFDSKHPQAVDKDEVVEYSYTVENRGATAVWLSVYQISGSGEYKKSGGYYGYESRYRAEFKLQPGESKTVIAQYLLGSNGNALTYIVFEQDVESFTVGIAIASKITGLTDVDAKYKNQAAVDNNVTIAYNKDDNQGVEVKAEYLTKRAGKFITSPTAGDFTAPDGVNVAKWQLVVGDETYDLPASIVDYNGLRLPSSGATLKAFIATDVTVSYVAVNGVSAEGAKTEYLQGDKLSLPAVTSATTDGRTHIGWFDTASGSVVTNDTVIMDNMTIAPYFAPSATKLTPLSGATANEKGCAYGPDNVTASLEGKFTKTAGVGGDELGIILGCTVPMESGNTFRFKTSYSLVAGTTYKFTIKLTNYSSDEISFTVYQLKSGTVTDGMPSKAVTLAGGGTTTVELSLETGKNDNALTYFVMNSAANQLSLGVAMSIETVTA